MRKVVREKDSYERGTYKISNKVWQLFAQTESVEKDIKWYTVYKLPEPDIKIFMRRQMMKKWA